MLPPDRISVIKLCPDAKICGHRKIEGAVTSLFEEFFDAVDDHCHFQEDEGEDSRPDLAAVQSVTPQVSVGAGLLEFISSAVPPQDVTLEQQDGQLDGEPQFMQPANGNAGEAGTPYLGISLGELSSISDTSREGEESRQQVMMELSEKLPDIDPQKTDHTDASFDVQNARAVPPEGDTDNLATSAGDENKKAEPVQVFEQPASIESAVPGATTVIIAAVAHQPARPLFAQIEHLLQSTFSSLNLQIATVRQGSDVRSLRLTLKPEHLGEVEVSMRQTGGEMHVRILVTSEATAISLQRDLEFLRERMDQVMQMEGKPAVTISVQSSNDELQPPALQQSENDGGMTGSNGNLPHGAGERQASRKRDAGSRQITNDSHDRDSLLQLGIAHIVV